MSNLELVKSLGANRVIDYTNEDFTKNGELYDVIFDTKGTTSFSHIKRSLKENGRYLSANPKMVDMVGGIWTLMTSSKKVILGASSQETKDLIFLRELIEEGKINSVIDRSYPLEQIREAHSYVEKGHKKGNVVITLKHNDKI